MLISEIKNKEVRERAEFYARSRDGISNRYEGFKMKVRVLSNTWYDAGAYTVGEVYNARKASDGRNYEVEDNDGGWLCMFPNELQFICPGVAVPSDER